MEKPPHPTVKLSNATFVPPSPPEPRENGPWSIDAPYAARVCAGRYLTTPDAVKQTGFLDLQLPSSLSFEPGDAFGVICHNPVSLVASLLSYWPDENPDTCFSFEQGGAQAVPRHLMGDLSLRYAFTYRCDLTALPSKAFIKSLAAYSPPELADKMREMATPKGREEWKREIEEPMPDVIELLKKYRVNIPPHALLVLLPSLQPRYYSAANSPLAYPGHLHIAFTIFDVALNEGRRRAGICTSMFKDILASCAANTLSPSPTVLLFPRTLGVPFRLPSDRSVPLILIGPGTGVAPFRGFLQHLRELRTREPSLSIGPVWLFFGCRHAGRDELFKDEMTEQLQSGVLSQYIVAYSREKDDVEYVQHKLTEHAQQVLPMLLQQRAFVYVCGDARSMTKAVLEALLRMMTASGLSEKEAMERRTQWMQEKRLLIDAW